jgi:hypothetical protein
MMNNETEANQWITRYLTPTRKDPGFDLTRSAFAALQRAQELRLMRVELLAQSFHYYGDFGAEVFGCERAHFPAEVQKQLQANARAIRDAVETAYAQWVRAGRQRRSLHQHARRFFVEGVRY